MKKILFKIFSETLFYGNILLHPLFLPLYLMIWCMYLPSHTGFAYLELVSNEIKIKWIILYGLLVVIIPILMLLFARMFRVIHTLFLDTVRDRRYFFLLLAVYNFSLFYMFRDMYWHPFFKPSILLVGVMSALLFAIILFTNNDFKISLHAAGMGAMTGFFMMLSMLYKVDLMTEVELSILLSGFVMLGRMLIKAHAFEELLSGWVLGLFVCMIIFATSYQDIDWLNF